MTAEPPTPTGGPRRRPLSPGTATFGVIASAIFLGASGLFVILADATAPTAAFLRCWIAVLALAPLVLGELRRRGRLPQRATIVTLCSGVALGLDYVLWAQSVLDAGVGVSTVLISVQVIVFPALVWALGGSRPGLLFIVCVPVMIVGMLLTGGVLGADVTADNPTRGAILGVLSGVLYGVYIFGIHHCRRLAPTFVVTPVAVGTVSAGVMTAIAGVAFGGLDFDLGVDGWAWMVALAIFGQALSWVLLSFCSPHVPVSRTAALMLLQPLSAVVLGSLVAGERMQPAQWIGAVLVAGIVWALGGGPEALKRRR
ncbi:drug/metabolite transporter (DMT)-like permease [Brevibacterium sanguinis]|uniref:Drug/metabolite transporter (DMT)-like permease n=2 Tax=Brevibacterium TaxID=1696 RepID=A0A366ILH0_9MICO|nr:MULTISPECIES: DMT family transporter [Brevibacterium]RBP67046.1 drug/metabolite transporter (DMT)-like permease [Brevibacterium sanguinis]RBP73571.1 drug/metabolite transporter (DMT)-like permease [Brevibacterium celere]